MVQKHLQDKAEAVQQQEEEKRKSVADKKREKEKAKKLALKESKGLAIAVDPEVFKAQEADRIAQQLIEVSET